VCQPKSQFVGQASENNRSEQNGGSGRKHETGTRNIYRPRRCADRETKRKRVERPNAEAQRENAEHYGCRLIDAPVERKANKRD
jgi:hypothetical protein